jgi:hypothetical protein
MELGVDQIEGDQAPREERRADCSKRPGEGNPCARAATGAERQVRDPTRAAPVQQLGGQHEQQRADARDVCYHGVYLNPNSAST